MLLELEDVAAIGAQGLEQSIREQQAAVGGIDVGLLARDQPAVEPDHAADPCAGWMPSWLPCASTSISALALARLSSYSACGSESATMPPPTWKVRSRPWMQ